ncbi:MAG: hypothetical protein GXP54_12510, partial [Deltaproteobacteria bacterium]|nr:hypothetical protein [Deltaproteobacteria bacterium]
MKHTISLMVTLFIAFPLLSGCKGTPGPKSAFEVWLKAIEKCDSAQIKAGLTTESVDAINKMTKQLKAF